MNKYHFFMEEGLKQQQQQPQQQQHRSSVDIPASSVCPSPSAYDAHLRASAAAAGLAAGLAANHQLLMGVSGDLSGGLNGGGGVMQHHHGHPQQHHDQVCQHHVMRRNLTRSLRRSLSALYGKRITHSFGIT